MTTFIINILAKAELKIGLSKSERIISTDVKVLGHVIRDSEQIGIYTRYDEIYDYDINECEPLDEKEFYLIQTNGERILNERYEISKIIEVFSENVEVVKE